MDATKMEAGRLLSGRYRLTTIIGRGGMGVVWRARDEVLTRDVAMKEIIWPPHLTAGEQEIACQRAFREAQIASRLSHLNVVRIYDILQEDGHPWIIMELLPYRSLRELVSEEGPLTPAQAARIGLGVLAALRAAHAEGIMHRDVKPANIAVSPDGRVVLTDFGIARAADTPTLTGGLLMGSPSYTAPERARGEQSGAPADMWGLGASLYTAVEGHPPFERNGALQTLTAVVADELPRAARAGALWPVISGLLRKDPAKRLTADEAERMLGRVAADGGIRQVMAKSWGRKAAASAVPAARPGSEPESGDGTIPAACADLATPPRPVTVPVLVPGPVPIPDPDSDPELAEPVGPAEPVAAGMPHNDAPLDGSAVVAGSAVVDGSGVIDDPPASAGAARTVSGSRRSRLPLAGLGVLGALAVVAAAALVLTGSLRHQVAGSGPRSHPVSQPSASPAASAPASPSPSASVSASASRSAAARASASSPGTSRTPVTAPRSAAGSPVSASAPYGTLPVGYYRFTNSTGFSIGVPRGWSISHVGHYVYISDPSDGNIFLLIDQSDHPKPNPLLDWQQQQANRAGTYPDYHLIRLASVYYPQAEKAADWEFTYLRNGVLVEILNRNILANAHHAYALYWSAPQSAWGSSYHFFREFAATFRPAS